MADWVEVYQDDVGEFRWRRKGGNGETLSESSEGYVNKSYAVDQAEVINPTVEVRVLGDE